MESVHHRHLFSQSAWSDSNRRSRAPKARGVPLSYTLPNVIHSPGKESNLRYRCIRTAS